ncbi:MAG: D-2-hydroxyacid dehydrogenase family protein [Acidimicrobiales bacterium]|nr:D-2-hydroxyacid dehydrogenase family protein [Acidimicrobiales bacterium]
MRVAVLDDYQHIAEEVADWASLPEGVTVDFIHEHFADEDALVEGVGDHDCIVCMRERTAFPASTLERLPNLRLLVTTGPFNAVIDTAACTANGITLCGTGGLLYPTTELTWALILAVTKGIAREDAAVRNGEWQVGMGTGLRGKTLGLVGVGRLGTATGLIAKAFGMHVIAWSQNLDLGMAHAVDFEAVSKDDLFRRSDVVSVHYVLSPRSHHLVGAAELALMRPSAYVVNTSRGPVIDEDALVDALRSGRLAGAGLDVFAVEPLPLDHPLRSLPNTVITPHIGYVTDETYRIFYGDAVADIAAFLAGAPVRVIA